MNPLSTPTQTPVARQWLGRPVASLDRYHQALLATVDGRRNIVQLESVARAIGLEAVALEHLREQGLIDFPED